MDHERMPAVRIRYPDETLRRHQLLGTFPGGLYDKEYSVLGSIWRSPYFGKLPFPCVRSLGSFLQPDKHPKDPMRSSKTLVMKYPSYDKATDNILLSLF